MRNALLLCSVLGLAACAEQQVYRPSPDDLADLQRRNEARALAQREEAERGVSPADRARFQREAARTIRENELLERALTSSPDYAQAVRRAAEANIAEAVPVVRETRQSREGRVTAEEARLSDAVERRRRERLGQQAQQARFAQDQQAATQCDMQARQVGAGYNNPRSLLNLESAAAEAQARDACLAGHLRSRPVLPVTPSDGGPTRTYVPTSRDRPTYDW